MNCELSFLPGSAKSFSTPPVSFQCIKRFVGGARSSVVMMSVVSESWGKSARLTNLSLPPNNNTVEPAYKAYVLSKKN